MPDITDDLAALRDGCAAGATALATVAMPDRLIRVVDECFGRLRVITHADEVLPLLRTDQIISGLLRVDAALAQVESA